MKPPIPVNSPIRFARRLVAVAVAAAIVVFAVPSSALADPVGSPLPTITKDWHALVGDFDHRNGLDVVVTRHYADQRLGGIYYSNGSGGWTLGFAFPGGDRHGCASGDVNGDGRLDLFCEIGADHGTAPAKADELWIQQGDGSFRNQAAKWGVTDPFGRGRRALFYDHNGDGLVDLYSTVWGVRPDGQRNENQLFINTGHSFVEQLGPATGNFAGERCVAHLDWNADGRQDLLLCSSTLRLFRNTSLGGQQDVSFLTGAPIAWPRDVQAADLNGDGLQDLIVVFANRVEIRLNLGTGNRFSQVSSSIPLSNGQRALVRDLTGDGRLDVYVTEGCVGGVDQVDALLVGPLWTKTPIGASASMGCGNEVVDVGGRLLIFNGDDATEGTVASLAYPF
jgi:hypothetical protein